MEVSIKPTKKRNHSEMQPLWPASVPKKPRSTKFRDRYAGNDTSLRNYAFDSSKSDPNISSSTLTCSGEESSLCHSDDLGYCEAAIHSTVVAQNPPSSPIFLLGYDIMTQVLANLNPVEIVQVLTMPLSKDWRQSYTSNRDLWKVLCCMKPFNLDDQDESSSTSSEDDSYCFLKWQPTVSDALSRHRLMYTSFVRCMKYLNQIKEDSLNGKPPAGLDRKHGLVSHSGASRGLKRILAGGKAAKAISFRGNGKKAPTILNSPIGVLADENQKKNKSTVNSSSALSKKPKYGNSMITSRLLGPSADNRPSYMNLPQSCAIFSIVNWMVAYPEVEGIQIMCTEVWPFLLEDERQRFTAQRYGLAEVVLKAMMAFKNSLKLHIAGFHTLVLLGRPLGGQEGMLVELIERPLAMGGTSLGTVVVLDRRNGDERLNGVDKILIVLESMKQFACEEKLQAMACWALVNLALVPAQKSILITHGGIKATINAMLNHPFNAEVQFRALFALINLAIPCKIQAASNNAGKTEKDVLDESVQEICNLVVTALKNFHHSCETIKNRAFLVLHNLSLTPDYLPILLWTPYCYKLLTQYADNEESDKVLRKSAMSTKRRLDDLLSQDSSMRTRFATWLMSEPDLPNDQIHDAFIKTRQTISNNLLL